MIVMIDTKTQNILLYKKDGLVKIPFTEAADIFEFIGNKKVMYVTNVMNVGANDIIALIRSMGIKTISAAEISNNKYIHATNEGTVYAGDLKFEGKYDCKLVDSDMKVILLSDHLIKKLLSINKLEIVGEIAKRKLDKGHKKALKKNLDDHEKSDERLSSIIMDTRVEDWDGNIDVNDHVGAVAIDLDGAGRVDAGGGASVNTMSELMEKMDEQ